MKWRLWGRVERVVVVVVVLVVLVLVEWFYQQLEATSSLFCFLHNIVG